LTAIVSSPTRLPVLDRRVVSAATAYARARERHVRLPRTTGEALTRSHRDRFPRAASSATVGSAYELSSVDSFTRSSGCTRSPRRTRGYRAEAGSVLGAIIVCDRRFGAGMVSVRRATDLTWAGKSSGPHASGMSQSRKRLARAALRGRHEGARTSRVPTTCAVVSRTPGLRPPGRSVAGHEIGTSVHTQVSCGHTRRSKGRTCQSLYVCHKRSYGDSLAWIRTGPCGVTPRSIAHRGLL
jgi:hypothetical protein